MPNEHNSIVITYRLMQGDTVRLGLRPMVSVRMHEAPVNRTVPEEPVVSAHHRWLDVTVGAGVPTIRLAVRDHVPHSPSMPSSEDLHYELEEQRGYPADGRVRGVPGYYKLDLQEHEQVTFIGSTEIARHSRRALAGRAGTTELERRNRLLVAASNPPPDSLTAELVLAADQFVIKPATRTADAARAKRGRRERAQHHCRLPLVHRLGPRHDDQSRRPHAVDRSRTPRRAIRC